jgi:branched-chain amino acid transport system permease protein
MRVMMQSKRTKQVALIVFVALVLVVILYLGSQKRFGLPQYVQLTLDGLRAGTIYALIGLGFVTVFSVTGIINFAQGAFVMLGALIAVSINNAEALTLTPLPKLILAILGAVALTTLIGLILERIAIYPARHATPLTLIIITVGAYITLQGMAQLIWGTSSYVLPAFTTLEQSDLTFRLGAIIIKAQSLWIWGSTLLVLLVLYYFFEKTIWGAGLRASAVNRRAARLMGISPNRMSALSFALAAAMGAIAGVVLAPATRPIYDMGLVLGLKGFVAAIMGGLINAPAAVIGGLLLGVIENIGAGVTKAGFKDIYAFGILILILLFRPQGIFGRQQTVDKV